MSNATPSALTKSRIRTTLVLNGAELPEAFMSSTLSALCNALDRNADKRTVRRIAGKVTRLGMVSK